MRIRTLGPLLAALLFTAGCDRAPADTAAEQDTAAAPGAAPATTPPPDVGSTGASADAASSMGAPDATATPPAPAARADASDRVSPLLAIPTAALVRFSSGELTTLASEAGALLGLPEPIRPQLNEVFLLSLVATPPKGGARSDAPIFASILGLPPRTAELAATLPEGLPPLATPPIAPLTLLAASLPASDTQAHLDALAAALESRHALTRLSGDDALRCPEPCASLGDERSVVALVGRADHVLVVAVDASEGTHLPWKTFAQTHLDARLAAPRARQTPALQAFMEAEGAALYARYADLLDIGAAVGMLDVHEAVQVATPDIRAAMLARGYHLVYLLFAHFGLEHAESEDITLRLRDHAERSGTSVEAVHSLTAEGVALYDSLDRARPVVPDYTGSTPPELNLAWSGAGEDALSRAHPPLTPSRLNKALAVSGLWGYALLLSQPISLGRAIADSDAITPGLIGGRLVYLDTQPRLTLAAALVFSDDAALNAMLEREKLFDIFPKAEWRESATRLEGAAKPTLLLTIGSGGTPASRLFAVSTTPLESLVEIHVGTPLLSLVTNDRATAGLPEEGLAWRRARQGSTIIDQIGARSDAPFPALVWSAPEGFTPLPEPSAEAPLGCWRALATNTADIFGAIARERDAPADVDRARLQACARRDPRLAARVAVLEDVMILMQDDPASLPVMTDITLPRSTSQLPMRDYDVAVSLTPDALYVASRRLIELEGRRIPGQHKKGGDSGIFVIPLERELMREAEALEEDPKRASFRAAVVGPGGGPAARFDMALIADAATPWRLLMEVGLTARKSSFKTALITRDADGDQHPVYVTYPWGGPAPVSPEPLKTVWIQITPSGFQVFTNETLLPSDDAACALTVCKRGADHDWAGLYTRLLKLKQEAGWSDHEAVFVSASSPDTPLKTLLQTLDAVRFQRASSPDAAAGEAFSDPAAFASAPIVTRRVDDVAGQAQRPVTLFPMAILGHPVGPDEEEEEEEEEEAIPDPPVTAE